MNFKNQFCPKPFEYLDIHYVDGEFRAYMCCPTWLPVNLGDIEKVGFKNLWNGEIAKEIRKSILNESFLYCSEELCPEIQSQNLHDKNFLYKKDYLDYLSYTQGEVPHGPKILYFSEDRSCNLKCPSCRKDYISLSEEDVDHLISVREGFMPELMRDVESLNICSSGDPFASQIYRKFLFELEGRKYPSLKINLNTNGVLLTSHVFEKMNKVHANLGSIFISLDAATEATYNKVRVGGNWDKVIQNIRDLVQAKKRGIIDHLQLDFVVQDNNFHEMPQFVKLGKELGVDQVYFQRISNWGTYSREEFKRKDMAHPQHAQYKRFLEVCRHPLMRNGLIKKGNIQRFIPKSNRDKAIEFIKDFSWLRRTRTKLKKILN
tara:strand:- start:174469 stop:175596 length:1128 start_codon:yes stop_codon:yes gene_type:complete